MGCENEELVPVFLNRSAQLVIAWLAVLKAGCTIMPLDPKYPPERMRLMLEDAEAKVVLTESSLKDRLPSLKKGQGKDAPSQETKGSGIAGDEEDPACTVVVLDASEMMARIKMAGKANLSGAGTLAAPKSSRDLAYAIYTSGSTGRPKYVSESSDEQTVIYDPHTLLFRPSHTKLDRGVMLEHRSIVNYITWHIPYYQMTDRDRVVGNAGLAFDASMAETWPTLCAGACLVPCLDLETRVSPSKLLRWFAEEKLTLSFLTTQLAEAVLEEEQVLSSFVNPAPCGKNANPPHPTPQ